MINVKSVTITPSTIYTGDLFVISVDVEASGFTWGGLINATWDTLKKYTWGKMKGGV